MPITVTPDRVDNAKLLVALDRARGRASEEWILRLANAKPAPDTATGQAAGPAPGAQPRPPRTIG